MYNERLCANSVVAYLGPSGSYSYIALEQNLGQVRKLECSSISQIFNSVDENDADLGLVPLENIIQGIVTESLDSLLKYAGRIIIIGNFTQDIDCCLGIISASGQSEIIEFQDYCNAVDDFNALNIERIYSHYQPLQQCSIFLDRFFPKAELFPMPSTSKALEHILSKEISNSAVIANETSLRKAGFRIIARNISNISDNKTRFIVIRKCDTYYNDMLFLNSSNEESAGLTHNEAYLTYIALNPKQDRQGLLHSILDIISARHEINLHSLHSRPDMKGGLVFFMEMEGSLSSNKVYNCLKDLNSFCQNETSKVAEVFVLGTYKKQAFFHPLFNTIGIIGGNGEMGLWFRKFLQSAGFNVISYDLDSELSLPLFIRNVQVVLFSVPMSKVNELIDRTLDLFAPGQLIVENCSIKSCSLPKLIEKSRKDVEVLGIHTMFSGKITNLKGENIIVTPTEKSGPLSREFQNIFYKYGANIHETSLEIHDNIVAHIQSLLHLILIGLGQIMENSFHSKNNLEPFLTPNSRAVFDSLIRVLSQSDQLLLDMQFLNDKNSKIRHNFIEVFGKLLSATESEDVSSLTSSIEMARKFFSIKST